MFNGTPMQNFPVITGTNNKNCYHKQMCQSPYLKVVVYISLLNLLLRVIQLKMSETVSEMFGLVTMTR